MGKMLDAALEYAEKGFSVIPVDQKKVSLIKWEPYQSAKASKEEINAWWTRFPAANIGIVTGEISNILVVDTDTESAIETINNAIPEGLDVPCQTTPKGGRHFVFAHYPRLVNRARVADGIDLRTNGGYFVAAPSINGTGKGWKWLVSPMHVIPPEVPQSVLSIINNALVFNSLLYRESTKPSLQPSTLSTSVYKIFEYGHRDEDLFHVANVLIKGGMRFEEATNILEIIGKYCNPPWGSISDDGPLEVKVKSALQRALKRERNLSDEVKEWLCLQKGVILSTELEKCLQLSTREEKKNLSIILKRLSIEGLIQRHGERSGYWRIKEQDEQEIDWESCDDTIIDVKWPFELEKLYLCLPKNIIIIAGSPDSGKTAFCLNFAGKNMEKGIKYFTSEMGALELKTRLRKSAIPLKKWKQVKFIERSHNFADVIEPDGINIVDYIEVPEEAWKIATPINEIFRKLNKGICIIALQKPKGRDIARGGESTLDRPRLYLSMGDNKIKIIKCKNWAQDSVNPNGLSIEYTLQQGFTFKRQSEWGIPYDETRR